MRLRRPDPLIMPDDVFSADSIVPPTPVLVIDSLLAELRGDGLIDRHRVVDMLLDVRNAIWTTNDYSAAVAPLLDQRKGVASSHDLRQGV